jgi:hypothetical protein
VERATTLDDDALLRSLHHPARQVAMKMLVMVLLAASLAGCVVYPARPAYYRPAVVVY